MNIPLKKSTVNKVNFYFVTIYISIYLDYFFIYFFIVITMAPTIANRSIKEVNINHKG